ncbi:MAG: DNA polymerase/3'-5' exonuclease PolX [Nitrospirota bacterium]
MPIYNSDIAKIFSQVGDLLEIQGENRFRVRAYRNAARTVRELSRSVADMIREGKDLSKLSGIGRDLAGKIAEIVETGQLTLHERLKKKIPLALSSLMGVEGIGPKRIKIIHEKLGIRSLNGLRKAAEEKKLRNLPGFGVKTEQNIREELEQVEKAKKRISLTEADEIAKPMLEYLSHIRGLKRLEVAGSYRRRKETVGDLDIIAAVKKGTRIIDRFVKFEDVKKIVAKGKTRSTIRLKNGFQVDIRVLPEVCYGAALHYFTGSKSHNIAVRKIGMKQDLKINEYGVFKGDKRIAGKTEKEVYKTVNLTYIEPELRENRGEIEAARSNKLPNLVTLENICGDLHAHTKLTDGHSSLKEMAEAAMNRGYAYIAITEHSRRVKMAHGLDTKALAGQIEEIDKVNAGLKEFVILKGIEVDILENGSLDLPDDILKELDVVVCAIHYRFNLSKKKQTARVLRAMDNPYFNIFAHPSGRLINKRQPYDIDVAKIMAAAKDKGCYLEVNAHPERLDLIDVHCKRAKDIGLKVAISTDAHSTDNLDFMQYGIGQARRGWIEPDDVLNTRNVKELKKLLKNK